MIPISTFGVSLLCNEAGCIRRAPDHRATAAADLVNIACLPASGQARMLRDRTDGGALTSMSDAEVAELIFEMTPEALVAYIRIATCPDNSSGLRARRACAAGNKPAARGGSVFCVNQQSRASLNRRTCFRACSGVGILANPISRPAGDRRRMCHSLKAMIAKPFAL